MKTYRAALVGTGSIGDAHVRAVEATSGRVALVAAVDIDAQRVAISPEARDREPLTRKLRDDAWPRRSRTSSSSPPRPRSTRP